MILVDIYKLSVKVELNTFPIRFWKWLSYSPVRISWSCKMEFKNSFIYILIIVTEVDHIMSLLNFLVCSVWICSVLKTHLLKSWPPARGEVVEVLELRGRKPGHWGCVNEETLALQPFLFPPPLLRHHGVSITLYHVLLPRWPTSPKTQRHY